jgi:CheY-like chemotaxis protein
MSTARILLVDDDTDDVQIITETIKNLHPEVQVLSASNGEIALDMLDKHADDHVSLVVLDLNMPKMNGTETLMNLKKDPRFEKIPVIIYSTSVNNLEKKKCILLGAHSYITKPLSYKESVETALLFIGLCKGQSFAKTRI